MIVAGNVVGRDVLLSQWRGRVVHWKGRGTKGSYGDGDGDDRKLVREVVLIPVVIATHSYLKILCAGFLSRTSFTTTIPNEMQQRHTIPSSLLQISIQLATMLQDDEDWDHGMRMEYIAIMRSKGEEELQFPVEYSR